MARIIKFLYLVLFLFAPLIYTSFNSELFELPKMYFVYTITTAIVTAHLVNWVNDKAPIFRRTFLDFPLILFLTSQVISTIVSVDPYTSFFGYYSRLNGGLLSLICYALLYWVLVIYIDEKFKERIIAFSLISGFLVSSYGILEHFGIDKNSWVQDVTTRVFSTLGQPNWLAAYLCILLPLALYKFLSSSGFIHKSYFLFLISNFYLCLLFTKSKSGIIAAIISLTIFGILYFLKNKKHNLFLLVSSFTFLVSLSLLINNPIKNKLFPSLTTNHYPLNTGLNITPSEDIRKIVWQGAFDLWKKYPIFGTGVETFAYSYYWVRPVAHNVTSEWEFLYNKAHNEYLNYLATTGTFGFLTYMVLIFSILFYLIKNSKLKIENLAILSAIANILITNAAGFSVVIVSLYFFLLPALILPITDHQSLITKKSPIFYFPILLLTFLLLKSIIYGYLADITFAQSESADNRNDYQIAHDYLASSIYYRPHEPLYLSKISTLESKLAIIANSNKNTKDTDYWTKIAIAHSQQSLTVSPLNNNYLKEQAQMYYYLATIDKKYFPKSIDSLYQASQLAPTDAKIYYLIGEFLRSGGANQKAIQYLLKAIELKPNYDHAYFMSGQIYFENKDYQNAKSMFDKTIQIAPTNQDAKDYLAKISKIKN